TGLLTGTGGAVSNLGNAVKSLGAGPLSPLSPVTTLVGDLANTVGTAVNSTASDLNTALNSTPVQQLETQLGKVINPITNTLTGGVDKPGVTQTLGSATLLGAPLNGLLST
ncbi:hypothetical protein CA830_33180, partial [Burkholderia multivorans]